MPIFFFKFWQIANIYHNFLFPKTTLFIIKFGSDRMKTGGVEFWNFAPIRSHINEKKKIVKIWKLKILDKKMVWRYGGQGATHKIWPGSMQRFLRNLSLRATDDCAMTVGLLTKSSRTKNWIQSLLKKDINWKFQNSMRQLTFVSINTGNKKKVGWKRVKLLEE